MKQHHYARILAVLVMGVIALSFYRNPEVRTGSRIPAQYAGDFNLAAKQPGTHGLFSPRLGIGFTYHAPEPLHVWESGTTMHIDGSEIASNKTIEVFEIAPAPSITLAIRDNVLMGTSDQDCYVTLLSFATTPYQTATINYPVDESLDEPWWVSPSAEKCPAKYRASNELSYFLFNAEVPTKLLFVKLGQDSIATDGTVLAEGQEAMDWSQSIRILE